MGRTKITEEQKDYIIAHAYTKTSETIAKDLGILPQVVKYWRNKFQLKINNSQANHITYYGTAFPTPEQIKELRNRNAKRYMDKKRAAIEQPHPNKFKKIMKKRVIKTSKTKLPADEKPQKLESVETGGTWVRINEKTIVYRKQG